MILKDYLKKHRIKQTEMAELLKMSKSALNLITNFKYEPSYTTKLAIEHITNGLVSTDDWKNPSQVSCKTN